MVNLSKGEQELYDYLARFQGTEISIAELSEMFYAKRKKPKHHRGSISAMMRTLMLKAEVMGIKITRTSRLGVSSTGVYRLEWGQ